MGRKRNQKKRSPPKHDVKQLPRSDSNETLIDNNTKFPLDCKSPEIEKVTNSETDSGSSDIQKALQEELNSLPKLSTSDQDSTRQRSITELNESSLLMATPYASKSAEFVEINSTFASTIGSEITGMCKTPIAANSELLEDSSNLNKDEDDDEVPLFHLQSQQTSIASPSRKSSNSISMHQDISVYQIRPGSLSSSPNRLNIEDKSQQKEIEIPRVLDSLIRDQPKISSPQKPETDSPSKKLRPRSTSSSSKQSAILTPLDPIAEALDTVKQETPKDAKVVSFDLQPTHIEHSAPKSFPRPTPNGFRVSMSFSDEIHFDTSEAEPVEVIKASSQRISPAKVDPASAKLADSTVINSVLLAPQTEAPENSNRSALPKAPAGNIQKEGSSFKNRIFHVKSKPRQRQVSFSEAPATLIVSELPSTASTSSFSLPIPLKHQPVKERSGLSKLWNGICSKFKYNKPKEPEIDYAAIRSQQLLPLEVQIPDHSFLTDLTEDQHFEDVDYSVVGNAKSKSLDLSEKEASLKRAYLTYEKFNKQIAMSRKSLSFIN